ncbi:MAG: hypothetical protein JWM76_2328, partial [Pseudonocardiales bacterium]|nr:hypothetical protein [Pseudonocardiales bacterium]
WTADVVVAVHFGYLAFLVAGGYIAWRWPRTIALHVVAAVWAVLIVTTSVACPLTALQNNLREHAGQGPLHGGGFIQLYVRGTLYPANEQAASQAVVGAVVLFSWLALFMRHRGRRQSGSGPIRAVDLVGRRGTVAP